MSNVCKFWEPHARRTLRDCTDLNNDWFTIYLLEVSNIWKKKKEIQIVKAISNDINMNCGLEKCAKIF